MPDSDHRAPFRSRDAALGTEEKSRTPAGPQPRSDPQQQSEPRQRPREQGRWSRLKALRRSEMPRAGAPRRARRLGLALVALIGAGAIAAAVSSLDLGKIGDALVSARPGWIAAALALMMVSLLARSVSWRATLKAALPDTPIGQLAVTRATMIGVMGSAVFPGRLGEPSRVLVVSRRLNAPTRRMLPIVAGTVFSQTLINLFALAILAVVTLTSVHLLKGSASGLEAAIGVPLLIVAIVLVGPYAMRMGKRARSEKVRRLTERTTRLFHLAAQGLRVFARPRHGLPAIGAQLLAWALQWAACYMVLRALGLQHEAGLTAAAAILLAVNVSAVLPATPSNVGVFQAACLVVLAAYGVGAGPGLAYGIILQAVEVITALALGIPALLGEGMSWQDMRRPKDIGGQPAHGNASEDEPDGGGPNPGPNPGELSDDGVGEQDLATDARR